MSRDFTKTDTSRDGEKRINYQTPESEDSDDLFDEDVDLSDLTEGVEEPWSDPDVLHTMYYNLDMTQKEIAEEFDKSKMVIAMYLSEHGIKQ